MWQQEANGDFLPGFMTLIDSRQAEQSGRLWLSFCNDYIPGDHSQKHIKHLFSVSALSELDLYGASRKEIKLNIKMSEAVVWSYFLHPALLLQ